MKSKSAKYSTVYNHLFQTYGRDGYVRLSFFVQFINRLAKFFVLPVAVSLIITNLSDGNYDGAFTSVGLFIFGSLAIGILAPAVKYISLLGENILIPS